MTSKTALLLDKLIWFTLLTSAILTPLIFTTANTELFEVPKMFTVYIAAVLLLTFTTLKFVIEGKIQIPKNLIFFSLIALTTVQIISTLTSIDKFTSVFGYPTRLSGGLLSSFAYLIIFTTAQVNLNFQKAQKLILAMLASALAVSLWGIPGHFGFDPNCLILTGRLNAACWQQEFNPTIRIFSTLGQPNWLASFMVEVIPFALSFLLIFKKNLRLFSLLAIAALTLALLFTGSVSGVLGFAASIFVFSSLIGVTLIKKNFRLFLIAVAIGVSAIGMTGASLKSRILESLSQKQVASAGTPSGQIRLIVWQGAIAAFKSKPILGFGPETFVYSYYQFRPKAANATTEWNFYYNKAHNEFLNYLTNTGILGFTAYLFFIAASLFELFKITRVKTPASLWAKAAVASILGYLVTIFAGFSVVATQLFMFLSLAAALSMTNPSFKSFTFKTGGLTQKISNFLIIAFGLWLAIFVLRLYSADVLMNRAKSLQRLQPYESAISVFPAQNPFYFSDYSLILSIYTTSQKDANVTKILENLSQTYATKALNISPNNLLILRNVANSYAELSKENPAYKIKVLELNKKGVELAPTDPSTHLDLARAQFDLGQNEEAINSLHTALLLKPNFTEAKNLLEDIQGKKLQ